MLLRCLVSPFKSECFIKETKKGNQLIGHGQIPSVSCRLQWSLLKPTVCSHSVLSELNRPGQSWHSQSRQTEASSSLTGLAFMSADAYWTLGRAAEWLARRGAPPRRCSGMRRWLAKAPCQAFSGYLQWCQTPRWRGRDGDDLVHLRAGFDLGWVENQPKVQPDTRGEDITDSSHCTDVAILHF